MGEGSGAGDRSSCGIGGRFGGGECGIKRVGVGWKYPVFQLAGSCAAENNSVLQRAPKFYSAANHAFSKTTYNLQLRAPQEFTICSFHSAPQRPLPRPAPTMPRRP